MPKGIKGFQKGNKLGTLTRGNIKSPETIKKISEARKGKPAWNKGKPAPWTSKRNKETNYLRRGEKAYHWKGWNLRNRTSQGYG